MSTKLRVHRSLLSTRSVRNRRKYGDVIVAIILITIAVFSAIPLVMSIGMSLKPINELFYFPPRILPTEPTLDNFVLLFKRMKTTYVPFSRYAFNTIFLTLATTGGHLLLASMAATVFSAPLATRARGEAAAPPAKTAMRTAATTTTAATAMMMGILRLFFLGVGA